MADVRVLIVEDDTVVAQNLQAYLSDEDIRVDVAGSAEEGLDILKEDGGYAVGIVDMRLPGMDGQAFLVRARKLRPAMRFLIHTGSPGYATQEMCLALGVAPEHVFLKPIHNMETLMEAIRQLLKGMKTEKGA